MKSRQVILILFILSMFNMFSQSKKEPKKFQYKFKEPENTACFTCVHVINKEKDILYVSHDKDGDWQFLCGEEGHTEKDAKLVSLKSITELDESVNDLFEMPFNVGAERKSIKDKWKPFRL